jgi:hypothetical protein
MGEDQALGPLVESDHLVFVGDQNPMIVLEKIEQILVGRFSRFEGLGIEIGPLQ